MNCHFAAHLEAVNRRNDDFDHVYRTMVFTRPSNFSYVTAGTVLYFFVCCLLACLPHVFILPDHCNGIFLAGVSAAVQVRSANVCRFSLIL